MNPGELRYKIIIEKAVVVNDPDNIPVETWQETYQCRAKIVNVSGKEVVLNQGESFMDSKRFIIRYPRSIVINNFDRISYNGQRYGIKYINNVKERFEYLEIVAEVVIWV